MARVQSQLFELRDFTYHHQRVRLKPVTLTQNQALQKLWNIFQIFPSNNISKFIGMSPFITIKFNLERLILNFVDMFLFMWMNLNLWKFFKRYSNGKWWSRGENYSSSLLSTSIFALILTYDMCVFRVCIFFFDTFLDKRPDLATLLQKDSFIICLRKTRICYPCYIFSTWKKE